MLQYKLYCECYYLLSSTNESFCIAFRISGRLHFRTIRKTQLLTISVKNVKGNVIVRYCFLLNMLMLWEKTSCRKVLSFNYQHPIYLPDALNEKKRPEKYLIIIYFID